MDRLSKKIIMHMVRHQKRTLADYSCAFPGPFEDHCSITLDEFCKQIQKPPRDVKKSVDYLLSNGYLEYRTFFPDAEKPVHYGFRLSYKGLHFREFQLQNFLRYVADKWIDFLALIIAIASFILSCIALQN